MICEGIAVGACLEGPRSCKVKALMQDTMFVVSVMLFCFHVAFIIPCNLSLYNSSTIVIILNKDVPGL